MSARGNGTVHLGMRHKIVDPIEDMAAFDELPAPLRAALDYHPINLAAEPVLALWCDPDVLADYDCIERMQMFLAKLGQAASLAR